MAPIRAVQTETAAVERRRGTAATVQRSAAAPSAARTLQERLGNHGAQAFIARSTATPAKEGTSRAPVGQPMLQRQPVMVGPPLMIGPTEKSSDRMQKIADELWVRFPLVARVFLLEWFSGSSAGVNSVPEPSDPDASTYWWIALAGNITWAATSLLAPELTIPIRLMSFGGAAVGSGTLQQLYGADMPAGKPLLIQRLAEARDKMEKVIDPAIKDALVAAATKNVTDPTAQDKLLWKRMFPGVPYDSRTGVITKTAIAEASSALGDFVKQYVSWNKEIRSIVDKERLKNNPFTGGDLGESGARAGYFLRPVSNSERAMAASQHPFNPQLKFKGL